MCDVCYRQTRCAEGRLIAGFNEGLSGGFVALHVDERGKTLDMCREVSDSGVCWIGDTSCAIGERRLGGVFVRAGS
ncbi:MAG: hypothetical protein Q8P61_05375 [Candidatus Nanopelagicales bacterium]|nr:hypothetical protein [Candidatus Nanopelagicales bacterium]